MSEEGVPVKLVIEEPDGTVQTMEFEQDTIKIGRGRPGKKRKGVDVQLSDESVARVAAVLHVRGLNDVHIMDMGSGGTTIDGKAVGSRGKVSSGTEVMIGNTKITAYIGDDAAQSHSMEFDNALLDDDDVLEVVDDEQGVLVQANVSYEHLDGVPMLDDGLPEQDLATDMGVGDQVSAHTFHADHADTGSHSPVGGEGFGAPATPAPHAAFGGQQAGFDAGAQIPSQGSFGLPPASQENPGIPEGFGMYPVHQSPMGYVGPVGPPPPPLPETMAPNLAMLLDVADRLGKETWLSQMPLW